MPMSIIVTNEVEIKGEQIETHGILRKIQKTIHHKSSVPSLIPKAR